MSDMVTPKDSGAEGGARAGQDDRLDPTLMFGGSGRLPTAAEIVAQTILQMVADGKRATAQKQLERDAPVLARHERGEGAGVDVDAIVELARETEVIPDMFAVPMAQMLRVTYAPEAKMDLVRAVGEHPDTAKRMRDAIQSAAPCIARIFGGLIDDAMSLPRKATGKHRVSRSRLWILVVLLLVTIAGAVVFFTTQT